MSDSDGSDAGRGQDRTPEGRASRPVTAAARRERRASTRPSGKAKADTERTRPKGKVEAEPVAGSKRERQERTPRRDRKDRKPSLVGRLVRFVREVWAELRKVIWPNRRQMATYTAVVLVFVVFMVALTAGLDYGVGKLVAAVFGS